MDNKKGYRPWKNYSEDKNHNKSSRQNDLDNNRLGLDPEKTDKLVDSLTSIVMEERRKNILRNPRAARPQYMREDPTTPLIREVPFGPDTRSLQIPDSSPRVINPHTGDMRRFDIPSHNMAEFDKFEAEQNRLPKDKQFPLHEKGFRVIPRGEISVPQEQERKVLPFEKRNYDHGYLKARSNRTHQSDKDAEAIARELLLDEGSSRFVNKQTHKIRPNKPVRSDYASIIHAEKGFKGIVKKETTFVVAEGNKPEYVEVRPLEKK